MLETYMRPKFEPIFNHLAKLIKNLNISSNSITFFGLSCGIISGIFISIKMHIFATSFLWISGISDALDGIVARLKKDSSPLGAYFDLLSDRMVESAVILGFSIAYPQFSIAYIIFLITLLLHFSSFILTGALFKNSGNKSMHYDKSIIERIDAFIVFTLMIFLPKYIHFLLYPLNFIIFFSAISRILRVHKLSKLRN